MFPFDTPLEVAYPLATVHPLVLLLEASPLTMVVVPFVGSLFIRCSKVSVGEQANWADFATPFEWGPLPFKAALRFWRYVLLKKSQNKNQNRIAWEPIQ